jgi:hypothetical protein
MITKFPSGPASPQGHQQRSPYTARGKLAWHRAEAWSSAFSSEFRYDRGSQGEYMSDKPRLGDAEVASAKYNFAEAKASLACEGIYLTEEEEALFRRFEEERLSHEECRRRLAEFCRAKRTQRTPAPS